MYRSIEAVDASKGPTTEDCGNGPEQKHDCISRKNKSGHEREYQTNQLSTKTGYLFAGAVNNDY